jgi:hypothetical protein
MRIYIATVASLSGKVSAIDGTGAKRLLSIGDQVHTDEVVRTAINSYVEISIADGSSVKIEALQSIRLTEDIFPSQTSNSADSVLNVGLSTEIINQLFSAYPFEEPSILSDIEPVYEIKDFKQLGIAKNHTTKLMFDDILLSSNERNSLERFLQFDEAGENTTVYFSIQGEFTDPSTAQLQADKALIINSVGYSDSAELLSYLIENYQLIVQS